MRIHKIIGNHSGRELCRFTMTADEYSQLDNDSMGLCVQCGADRDSVEPDARKYPCEACGENGVYGVAELLMADVIQIEE